MTFRTFNGVTLNYQTIGDVRTQPTIVFINSLGTDFRIWDDVVAALAPGFAMVLYDKRGHGLSDLSEGPFAMADLVAELSSLLDHLGVSKAVMCGLSVGGIISLGLSATRPDLISGLILSDTAHKIGPPQMWNDRMATVRDGGIEAISEATLQRWFSDGFFADHGEALNGYRNMLVRTPREGYLHTCAAIRDTDYTEAAKAVTVPTLCMVGDEDGATPPKLVGELAALIPGAGFEIIPGAGHLPCIERPDVVSDLIQDFMGRL